MTCRDLIIEAFEEIKVYSPGETPSSDDISLGLTRLQRISDAYLGTASPTLTLDSAVPGPVPEAFMYELAMRLAGPSGGAFTGEQKDLWKKARSRMFAILNIPADADPELALLNLPSNYYYRYISFNTGV